MTPTDLAGPGVPPTGPASATPEPVEWDKEVTLEVTVRVRVRTDERYFEGLDGRTPEGMACAAVWCGRDRPDNLDGYADFTGDIDITWIDEAP